MNKIDTADLDCIYLTYDEPQREEFWVKIKNMIPWAKRVDGVRGSDAAHKAAAAASDTERFILIMATTCLLQIFSTKHWNCPQLTTSKQCSAGALGIM